MMTGPVTIYHDRPGSSLRNSGSPLTRNIMQQVIPALRITDYELTEEMKGTVYSKSLRQMRQQASDSQADWISGSRSHRIARRRN
jgi:hypothetical protein